MRIEYSNASYHALKAGKPRKGSIIVDSDHASYVYGGVVTYEAKDELKKQSSPE